MSSGLSALYDFAQMFRSLMSAFVDFRKKRKGGEAKGAGGKKVKKEETEEEKQLRVSTMKLLFFKPTLF